MSAFAKEKGINYRIFVDAGETATAFGIDGIPNSFFIDRQGRIAASTLQSQEALDRIAAGLVAEGGSPAAASTGGAKPASGG